MLANMLVLFLRKDLLVLERLRCWLFQPIHFPRRRNSEVPMTSLMFPRFSRVKFQRFDMYVWPRSLQQKKINICSSWWGIFRVHLPPFSSYFCLVVIVVIFPFPNYYCRTDTMHSSSLLFLIGFHLWSSQLDNTVATDETPPLFFAQRTTTRSGVVEIQQPPTKIQEKHATTVDFQQGTVKVTSVPLEMWQIIELPLPIVYMWGLSGGGGATTWKEKKKKKERKNRKKVHSTKSK